MDRVAFTLFGIDVMWYGVIIAAGLLLGIILSLKECRRIGFREDTLIDFLLTVIPVGIICARLYYVAFTWDDYSQNLVEIINIRHGGLAIHGGLFGGIIAGLIFCKIRKINLVRIIDIIAPPVILAQAIGRWGNFVNQEAYGGPTNLPWGIMVNGVKVHPTFLYESLGNIIIFFFLVWYRKHKRKNEGEVFALYLMLYSVVRFFVEGLRTDSLMFLGLRTAQIASIGMFLAGLTIFYILRRYKKDKLDDISESK
ncbi:MAG TPA: prolipoprotein diacylglyceryl transferase [Clostridiales bacterium]|nr:prolipoprotein diacylglyceryl transferase [Clostridiales bacterium]